MLKDLTGRRMSEAPLAPSVAADVATFTDYRGRRQRAARILREPPLHAFRGSDGCEGLRPLLAELAELVDMDLILLGHVSPSTYTTLAYFARTAEPSLQRGDTIPIGETYCREEITADAPFVLEDAEAEGIYAHHPGYVKHGLRAYVGAPIELADGTVLGTLCAVDANPKPVRPEAVQRLREIAQELSTEIDRRLNTTMEG